MVLGTHLAQSINPKTQYSTGARQRTCTWPAKTLPLHFDTLSVSRNGRSDHLALMAKAQHSTAYRAVPPLLRRLREEAGLSQRELGARMKRPQSWVYNCETANRRVDIMELIAWCRA